MKWCVVLLTGSACDEDPKTRCIMNVIGPLDSQPEAEAEAERWPAWTTPHMMLLMTPDEMQR